MSGKIQNGRHNQRNDQVQHTPVSQLFFDARNLLFLSSLIFIIDTGSEAAEAGGEDPKGGDSAVEEGAPGLRGLQGDCL